MNQIFKALFVIVGIVSMVEAVPNYKFAFQQIATYNGTTSSGVPFVKVYYLSKLFKVPHHMAIATCQAYGLEISKIDNLNEFQAVSAGLKTYTSLIDDYPWTDGTANHALSKWDWWSVVDGKQIFQPMPWISTAPNGAAEFCLSFGYINGVYGFDDYSCNAPNSFICMDIRY